MKGKFLQCLIVVMAFMFCVRLGSLVDSLVHGPEVGSIDVLVAAETKPSKPVEKEEGTEAKTDEGKVLSDDFFKKKFEEKSSAKLNEVFDPLTLTKGQVKVLESLHKRHLELDQREARLEEKEKVFSASRKELDGRLKALTEIGVELQATKKELEVMANKISDEDEKKILRLVKIYGGMKPKRAAVYFDQLGMSILMKVVENMKEGTSAAIMQLMDPKIVKVLTQNLAMKRKLPDRVAVAAKKEG